MFVLVEEKNTLFRRHKKTKQFINEHIQSLYADKKKSSDADMGEYVMTIIKVSDNVVYGLVFKKYGIAISKEPLFASECDNISDVFSSIRKYLDTRLDFITNTPNMEDRSKGLVIINKK
jgi:hypothetical protein